MAVIIRAEDIAEVMVVEVVLEVPWTREVIITPPIRITIHSLVDRQQPLWQQWQLNHRQVTYSLNLASCSEGTQ